jgi:non-ribosomal peptide synthetase component F
MKLGELVVERLHPPVRSPFRGRISSARYDLAVHVVQDDGRLAIHFNYDEVILDRTDVQLLCARYRSLLAAMAADPEHVVLSLQRVEESMHAVAERDNS